MQKVTVRDLRNNGGRVLDRVARGESMVVTRDGAEVAELRPRRRRSLPPADLLESWRHLPAVSLEELRADLDLVIDPTL